LQTQIPGELLISPLPPLASARSALVLIVLALMPLWATGMFGRGLWTPDEPREADIAWRMSLQSDRTLPQLAGTAFLEKPPLSYWMSAGAVSLFGDSAAAARAPNFLYALIGALCVGALALAMHSDAMAAVIAALVAMSALLAYRASVWLAPDSCLMAGCALALLGAWRGYRAPAGPQKALGYALMHLGAAIGFMAKSAPGWLVPGLALLTLIIWERRWSELRRWELYAGFALQALIILPWLIAVARTAQGTDALRALFWNNIFGRFTHIAAPAALDYTSGHHNPPGKYLLELPVYLLPWTVVVLAALVRAWTGGRSQDASATAWRFALAATLPFLALLSIAATARDIYAAPALFGFGLLAGLWAHAAQRSPNSLDRLALRLTRVLVLLIAWALALGLAGFSAARAAPQLPLWSAIFALLVVAHVSVWLGARAQRAGEVQKSLVWTYAGYAASFVLASLVVLPIIDRWQNLPALARRIHADTAHQRLALLNPDETTIAMLDHGLDMRFTILTSDGAGPAQAVGGWFSAAGSEARILVLMPGHGDGPLTRWLRHFHHGRLPDEGVAASLVAAGLAAMATQYELPQGRRYALLAPPSQAPPNASLPQ
jgi:4-amino-4-deoxy-L-arabinose transferase-like glycosyltransferase